MQMPSEVGGVRVRTLDDGSYYLSRMISADCLEWLDKHFIRVPGELRWYEHVDKRPEHTELTEMQSDTFYIIGKGPSLEFLHVADFPDTTIPIISINQASTKVESLELANDHYNIRQDYEALYEMPEKATLLLNHRLWYREKDRKNTYYYFPQLFALTDSTPTVVVAIELAKYHGARKLIMVAFDSYTHHDITSQRGVDGSYPRQRPLIDRALNGCSVEWLTPTPPY